jgi:hypothetical protein
VLSLIGSLINRLPGHDERFSPAPLIKDAALGVAEGRV